MANFLQLKMFNCNVSTNNTLIIYLSKCLTICNYFDNIIAQTYQKQEEQITIIMKICYNSLL